MNKLNLYLAALLFVLVFTAGAQTPSGESQHEEKPYIEVTGTAELEVVPDEIYINLIIRERFVNKEKITIEEQEAKLKNALRKTGVDLSNLYLTNANADFIRVRYRKKGVVTQKDYTLKVTDAVTVGKVFDELDSLEINDAYIARTSHTKMDSLKKELKIQAVKAAKAKADYLLNAIGEQTGKPLIVREDANIATALQRVPGVNYYANSRLGYLAEADGRDKPEEAEIQFQKVKLQAGIYVRFLIR